MVRRAFLPADSITTAVALAVRRAASVALAVEAARLAAAAQAENFNFSSPFTKGKFIVYQQL